MKLQQAQALAQTLVDSICPYCHRVEIAGSVRRRQSDVHDIEIVVTPRFSTDLFGDPNPNAPTQLDIVLSSMNNLLNVKSGPRYKQYAIVGQDINLDLFVVRPPAEWGVIFALRTGPAEYSHFLVTPRPQGGALPSHLSIHDGAVWQGSAILPTPEEIDFFDLLHLPYLEPQERQIDWKTAVQLLQNKPLLNIGDQQ
jgi:DNA polymerase/3'-5' exonuclease PolX